jgi:hypothetical protein
MKKSKLKEMIKARVKGLMEAGKEVVITTQDGTAKTASSTEKLRAKQASDNDDVVTYQKRGATNESTNKKSMNKEFLKMQKLAGLITEGQFQKKLNEMYDDDNEEDYVEKAFKASPNMHSYEDVLKMVEEFREHGYDDIPDSFIATFPKGKPVSKKDYYEWASKREETGDAYMYIMANWISISDPKFRL